jgi:outer membrane protein TolC
MKPFCFLLASAALYGQSLTIHEAIEKALAQYPATRVNEEQIKAAAAGINLARLAYLPKADAIAQLNRATRNNVYGMLLQQNVISPISGPPFPANAGTNVFGSAIGFLLQWEPFDFGLRKANIAVSETEKRRAEASLKKTRFEVAALTADAYLTVLAAKQSVAVARANRARLDAVESVVRSLVDSGLRPGLDASRTQAEKTALDGYLIQARQSLAIAEANLAQFVSGAKEVDDMKFLSAPALPPASASALSSHPAAAEQQVSIEESQMRLRALQRTYYPKFNTQGTVYARGTGANPDFTTGSFGSGLGPNVYNWGIGFTVTFPIMDLPGLRVKREIESSRTRTEQARLEQLLRDLEAQRARAQAQYDGATQLAANTPLQLKATREALQQVTARYKAGLIGILEVADAQRALANAEIEDALARLSVWRAKLAIATAEGDLSGFLAEAK